LPWLAVVGLLMVSGPRVWAGETLRVDSVMYHDPEVRLAGETVVLPPNLLPLWLRALEHPDDELRRLAADAIAKAHRLKLARMDETADELAAVLAEEPQDVLVQRALAQALVDIDARQTARLLARRAAEGHLQVAQVVEPALARWDYQPIREVWLARLSDARTPIASLLLAIEGMRVVRDSRAGPLLLALAANEQQPSNVRLAAAKSRARIDPTGLPKAASALAEGHIADRVVAVALLDSSDDAAAISLLQRMAQDEQPAVAAMAWERLLTIDSELAYDLAPAAILHRDALMRSCGARALMDKRDEDAVKLLAPLLGDMNPTLRRRVASFLHDVAQQGELREVAIGQTIVQLESENWRAIEQAALVLGELDYESAAPQMVERLDHPRYEVQITAAWALRRLAVAETLPPMLDRAVAQHEKVTSNSLGDEAQTVFDQLVQLFQGFGRMRCHEAESLMRAYVPKNSAWSGETRAAACWALGYLHQDEPVEDLVQEFSGRLADTSFLDPEYPAVRQMAAVSLGRMQAKSALPTLRSFTRIEGPNRPLGRVCGWAVEQMTGEVMPPAVDVVSPIMGWFLEPSKPLEE
jgi:HEAT repeat protein